MRTLDGIRRYKPEIKPEVKQTIKKGISWVSAAALFIGTFAIVAPFSAGAATTYALFGDATIVADGNPGNAAQIQSEATSDPNYGGVSVEPTDPISWADLETLSTDYNITDDDCGGGSPRVQIRVDTDGDGTSDGSVRIALGPSPSFTDCATGWQSSGNLIGNEDAGRYDYSVFGGSPFTTYSAAPEAVTAGQVVGITVVADGSWSDAATGGDGEQTVLVDNITVNSDVTTFDEEETAPALNAEDFGVVDYDTGVTGQLSGYTAGFGLTDATLAGATSVVVKLYSGPDESDLLQTNTAIIEKFNADITGTQFSSPFDVSGNFDYALDGYWTNVREAEYGQSVPATRVVATVTLEDGTIVTAENTNLTGDPTTIYPETPPVTTPTAKADCMNGGWMNVTNGSGMAFKNQGDCVSFVATQGKNDASGN